MAAIGVLAVQGAFARHAAVLDGLGHRTRLLRAASDFAGLDGLVLPGGESTVQLQLIERLGLAAPLCEHAARGKPILATCAGVILLARAVHNPEQDSFGLIDLAVTRNGWGRQLDSFEARSDDGRWPLVFIRAPRIGELGAGVEVLARYQGEPVLVRERAITCATFHPELTEDPQLHAQVFGARARHVA
jgi:pyridoxal 5'-phosphate synthase pdxT subunit